MTKTTPSKRTVRPENYPWQVYVQFGDSKKSYSFAADREYKTNDEVVVETAQGLEIGRVCVPAMPFSFDKARTDIKPVVRKATKDDFRHREENIQRASRAMKICQEAIAKDKLDMHLISCTYSLDGSKVVFTYLSEQRVDFRNLLKDLSGKVSGRIELRQVGPRNKAKMVGGIGCCGMECCCSRFMNDFETVSINMAKNQMLALNISKLSGQCGKLKCCLRFENEEYTRLRRGLPKINSAMEYNGNRYRMTSLNLIQKTARLENREETIFVSFAELFPDRIEEEKAAGKKPEPQESESGDPYVVKAQNPALRGQSE